jgi:hypothetical protein
LLPYHGEFGSVFDLSELMAARDPCERKRLLDAFLADPHLAELDRELGFAGAFPADQRGTFDADRFMDRGRVAVEAYVRQAAPRLAVVFTRDANFAPCIEQKLAALACCHVSMARTAPPPVPLDASERVRRIFGRHAGPVRLTPVRGATVLRSDGPTGQASRYAFRLSTDADPPSHSAGTARAEAGRAVFVDDVDWDPQTGAIQRAAGDARGRCVRTQIIIKGVGATPYANNRFSSRASGGLTWLQGERDWVHSDVLARGGVPVYRPLELALLPYCDWHPGMGWRPLVTYARLPQENLRISDLELLSQPKRRAVVAALRGKIAALAGVSPRGISAGQLVRFVVSRIGRIAGLCEAGTTFGGRPFFHGFLHRQNISLLGELVDLGEGRFVGDARELECAYAESGYVNGERAWSSRVRQARREATPFQHLAHLWAALLAPALEVGERQPPPEVDALFWRAHAEGIDGRPADQVDAMLAV